MGPTTTPTATGPTTPTVTTPTATGPTATGPMATTPTTTPTVTTPTTPTTTPTATGPMATTPTVTTPTVTGPMVTGHHQRRHRTVWPSPPRHSPGCLWPCSCTSGAPSREWPGCKCEETQDCRVSQGPPHKLGLGKRRSCFPSEGLWGVSLPPLSRELVARLASAVGRFRPCLKSSVVTPDKNKKLIETYRDPPSLQMHQSSFTPGWSILLPASLGALAFG